MDVIYLCSRFSHGGSLVMEAAVEVVWSWRWFGHGGGLVMEAAVEVVWSWRWFGHGGGVAGLVLRVVEVAVPHPSHHTCRQARQMRDKW